MHRVDLEGRVRETCEEVRSHTLYDSSTGNRELRLGRQLKKIPIESWVFWNFSLLLLGWLVCRSFSTQGENLLS